MISATTVAIAAKTDRHACRSNGRGQRSRHVARVRVDAGERPVSGVRDPKRARAESDRAWTVAHGDRLDDLVRSRVDARDGSIEPICDPDPAAAHGQPGGPAADRDRLAHDLRRPIDARDAVAIRVGDPDRTIAHSERAWRRTGDGDERPDPVPSGIDHAHRIRRQAGNTPSASGQLQGCCGDARCEQHQCANRDGQARSAGSRCGLHRPRIARSTSELWILSENRLLQFPQRGPGIEAQLLVQDPTSLPVGVQRFGLATAAVEGEHQLSS